MHMTNAARFRHQDSSIDEYHNHVPTLEYDVSNIVQNGNHTSMLPQEEEHHRQHEEEEDEDEP